MNRKPHREVAQSNPPHVLIVEDDPISRYALQALLCASGYRAQAAASGEEAVRLASESSSPTVALIDLDLPGMDGAQCYQHLRDLRPDMHAVFVTAADRERVQALVQQDLPHLRKPVDVQCLMSILSETASCADQP